MLENSWIFPTVEAVHLIGMAILAGAIVLDDLAILGWAPQVNIARCWRLIGLITISVTGLVLFFADSDRYLSNPAFTVKLALLALAVAVHFVRNSKAKAIASLSLWTLLVFASRAIIDFDV